MIRGQTNRCVAVYRKSIGLYSSKITLSRCEEYAQTLQLPASSCEAYLCSWRTKSSCHKSSIGVLAARMFASRWDLHYLSIPGDNKTSHKSKMLKHFAIKTLYFRSFDVSAMSHRWGIFSAERLNTLYLLHSAKSRSSTKPISEPFQTDKSNSSPPTNETIKAPSRYIINLINPT